MSSSIPRMSLTVASMLSSLSASRFVIKRLNMPAPSVDRMVTMNLSSRLFHRGSCEEVFVNHRIILQQQPLLCSWSWSTVWLPLEVKATEAITTKIVASVRKVPTTQETDLWIFLDGFPAILGACVGASSLFCCSLCISWFSWTSLVSLSSGAWVNSWSW